MRIILATSNEGDIVADEQVIRNRFRDVKKTKL